ncbi:unnamed protein product [Chrysoparadoxa australica]
MPSLLWLKTAAANNAALGLPHTSHCILPSPFFVLVVVVNEEREHPCISTRRRNRAGGGMNVALRELQWRKHSNERNIRRALVMTREMQERDLLLQLTPQASRARWQEGVITSEMGRPLFADGSFLLTFGERKKAMQESRKRMKEKALAISIASGCGSSLCDDSLARSLPQSGAKDP